jgi:competence protein ComEC
LLAVIFRRRALSMHTLALSIGAVLLLQPEAVMSAGFQMSFSAVAALIASYESWRFRKRKKAPIDRPGPIRDFTTGMIATSLIAGQATLAIAAYHFHRIASFGLIGNFLAMPAFSLIVMPMGALALITMPLGWEAIPLIIMSFGMDILFAAADMTASLPLALKPVTAIPGPTFIVYLIGFCLLILGHKVLKLSGVALITLSVTSWVLTDHPDIFISQSGITVSHTENNPDIWTVSSTQRDQFDVQVFLESQGYVLPPEISDFFCDEFGCFGRVQSVRITLLENIDQFIEDCQHTDLMITELNIPVWAKSNCSAYILDPDRLSRLGSAVVWIKDGQITRIEHVETGARNRPWSVE